MLSLSRQERRIQRRIEACHRVFRSERLDKAFKLKKVLPSLEHAMARLSAGAYGVCSDCGEKISDDRLHAVPGAIRCVACQEQHEK
jgi:RNA polymerase-binding transcription factor DksA